MASATDIVARFAPQAKAAYGTAFADGDALLDQFGVTTPIRLAHFMAQCFAETGALTLLIEGGGYTEIGLGKMWDAGNWHHYFADRAACLAMAGQCAVDHGEALFALVYGGRMGNAAPPSQDGWTYRGRGMLQTTGRAGYRSAGRACQVDFEGNPDLMIDPANLLKPALNLWASGHLNQAADNNDIEVITRTVNGGLTDLDGRKAWFAKFWPFVTGASGVEQSPEWQVQTKLLALGYAIGQPDGVVGAKTRAAILDYRARNGLPPSPGITPDLLLALGIG